MAHFETASGSGQGVTRWSDDDDFLGPMRPHRQAPSPPPRLRPERRHRSWLWSLVNAAIDAHLEATPDAKPG